MSLDSSVYGWAVSDQSRDQRRLAGDGTETRRRKKRTLTGAFFLSLRLRNLLTPFMMK
jgi:hypothetical protein